LLAIKDSISAADIYPDGCLSDQEYVMNVDASIKATVTIQHASKHLLPFRGEGWDEG